MEPNFFLNQRQNLLSFWFLANSLRLMAAIIAWIHLDRT